MYNTSDNMVDEKGIPIIAKSHIFNSNPGLSKTNMHCINLNPIIKVSF